MNKAISALVALVVMSLAVCFVFAEATPKLVDETLVEALRAGGYNLYFRHETTNWSQSDDVLKAGDWLSCDGNRMRQLSSDGRANARAIGQSIRAFGIPIGKLLASPYCRTVETARLMGLGTVETTTDVMNLRVAEYFGGQAAIVATAQALLATLPTPGTNTLIVAHGNVARLATSVYPDEGECIVFKPNKNGGFHLVGRMKVADWLRLKAPTLR